MPPKETKKTTTEAKSAKTSRTPGAKPKESPTKAKKPETFFESEDRENEFLQWFWEENNGNNLIKKLNAFAQKSEIDDRIRREKESPVVYCLGLNHGDFPFKDEKGKQWKLCKVGFTHGTIKKGQNNRMEQVCNQIVSKYTNEGKENKGAEAEILFRLRIGAVDTTLFSSTEKRIREKVGKPLRKEKAKALHLAISTEWVLTTLEYIDAIKKRKEEKIKEVDESGEGDVIDFFKEFKDPPTPPEKYKEWLKQK